MARRITIVPRAARAIADAQVWWLANRLAAPEALDQELQRGLALVAQQPNIGTRAENTRIAGVRRVYLSRIRYYLYYRLKPASESVEVLAFWHASRGSLPEL